MINEHEFNKQRCQNTHQLTQFYLSSTLPYIQKQAPLSSTGAHSSTINVHQQSIAQGSTQHSYNQKSISSSCEGAHFPKASKKPHQVVGIRGVLHPESIAILDAALGCSECMLNGTLQAAYHQLVAVRASVAPLSDSWPDTFLQHTTVQLPSASCRSSGFLGHCRRHHLGPTCSTKCCVSIFNMRIQQAQSL